MGTARMESAKGSGTAGLRRRGDRRAGRVLKPQSGNQPVSLRINAVVVGTIEPCDAIRIVSIALAAVLTRPSR